MNRCELVFRQQYRRENNTTARRKPQNTARQNDRLRRHSDAKQSEKYMKIKKLGYYCFSRRLVLPRPPASSRVLPPSQLLSNDPFVWTCLDVVRMLRSVSLSSRPDAAFVTRRRKRKWRRRRRREWAGLGDGSRRTRREIFLREFCLGCRACAR